MKPHRLLGLALSLVGSLAGAEPGRVDLHLHVTMDRAAIPVFRGEPGKPVLADSPGQRFTNQIDFKGLWDNKIWLAWGSMWIPLPYRPNRGVTGEALHQATELKRFVHEQPGFGLAETPAEARRLHQAGRIALMPTLEGGDGVLQLSDVDRIFKSGVRAMTIVHFSDNEIGGAAAGQFASNVLGQYEVKARNPHGLSDLGKEVVKRMAQLGMVVDLAHASDQTSKDTLDILEPLGVPAVVSHASCRAYAPTERAIPDELAQRVVRGGGMVGVPLYNKQVRDVPKEHQFPGMVPGTCDDIIAHWLHYKEVVGAANVTLGSDFNGFIIRPAKGGSCPEGLRSVEDLGDFYAGIQKQGETLEELDSAYESFLTLWQKVETKADPKARAEAMKVVVPGVDLFDTP
ncbi:MAG: membrane dipeptidase [Myxococcaceae bacterium]